MASMTMKTAQLPLTLLLTLSILAACSGDDGDNDSGGGSGGSTSNSGSGGSASGGKAGSSPAGSSSGGKASAGSNNGGSGGSGNNTGGTGGISFAGFGGINPDDYMCDPVPEAGSDCAADAQPCLNGMEVCGCQEGMWQCIDLGGGEGGGPGGGLGEIECPATQPMSNTPCGDTIGICPYGQNMGCVCANGNWMCT
jgi:hypothetical protein